MPNLQASDFTSLLIHVKPCAWADVYNHFILGWTVRDAAVRGLLLRAGEPGLAGLQGRTLQSTSARIHTWLVAIYFILSQT